MWRNLFFLKLSLTFCTFVCLLSRVEQRYSDLRRGRFQSECCYRRSKLESVFGLVQWQRLSEQEVMTSWGVGNNTMTCMTLQSMSALLAVTHAPAMPANASKLLSRNSENKIVSFIKSEFSICICDQNCSKTHTSQLIMRLHLSLESDEISWNIWTDWNLFHFIGWVFSDFSWTMFHRSTLAFSLSSDSIVHVMCESVCSHFVACAHTMAQWPNDPLHVICHFQVDISSWSSCQCFFAHSPIGVIASASSQLMILDHHFDWQLSSFQSSAHHLLHMNWLV